MPHKNYMPAWEEIACQRGHEVHVTQSVKTRLANHGYTDLPMIPPELMGDFEINIWDPGEYPVDGGPYCPAHDAVSATILSHGVWEPRESIVALHAFQRGDGVFYDIGAQIGWFSVLAARSGIPVVAYECDEDNRGLLRSNLRGLPVPQDVYDERISGMTVPSPAGPRICLAKIDIEGAEKHALAMLVPSIEAGLVDRILMEVSPVFRDDYGDLVEALIWEGYDAFCLPPRGTRRPFDGSRASLEPYKLIDDGHLKDEINTWHQEDVVFIREGVE